MPTRGLGPVCQTPGRRAPCIGLRPTTSSRATGTMAGMVAEVSAHRWPEHVSEWTVEMLDTLPEGNLRYELLDGTLLVSPSPVTKHQIAVGEL